MFTFANTDGSVNKLVTVFAEVTVLNREAT